MRWYEYKMETDDLCAPEDLKAKLLAMTDQLTEEEKNQPMMKTPAPARPAPVQRKKPVRFPVKRVGTLAACLAVCAVFHKIFQQCNLRGRSAVYRVNVPVEYGFHSPVQA